MFQKELVNYYVLPKLNFILLKLHSVQTTIDTLCKFVGQQQINKIVIFAAILFHYAVRMKFFIFNISSNKRSL